jgi:RNA ligase
MAGEQAMMRPHLSDLFDPADLTDAVADGHVRRQAHSALPLEILNYTERAQFEQAWTPVTLKCRGLIADQSGEIVARPWAKFFNYGDPLAGVLDLNAKAEVTDKLDGSLGILYPAGDGWAIATRGSFTSEQAIHATEVLRDRYWGFGPPNGMTVLFEIVYPANRIVCDYGATDDLMLLGAVDIATGEAVGPDWISGWWGPQAETFAADTLAEALALPPRANVEGIVVRLVDSGVMVKIKQPDYVELHKIVTGMNARVVWEQLGAGKTVREVCEPLPDEFHPWVRKVAYDLIEKADQIRDAASEEHRRSTARTLPRRSGGRCGRPASPGPFTTERTWRDADALRHPGTAGQREDVLRRRVGRRGPRRPGAGEPRRLAGDDPR